MSKRTMQILSVVLVCLVCGVGFGQEKWDGADDLTGDIWREGKVGIGIQTPGTNLDIVGTMRVRSIMQFRHNNGNGTVNLRLSGNGNYLHFDGSGLIGGGDNSQNLGISGWRFKDLWLGGNAHIGNNTTIDGSVCIGATNPFAYKLYVNGITYFSDYLNFKNIGFITYGSLGTNSAFKIYAKENQYLTFGVYNSLHQFVIDSEGKIGIGIQEPETNIDILGTMRIRNTIQFRHNNGNGIVNLKLSGNGSYLHFDGSGLIGGSDNSQDLGVSGWRFKDLWLGGNAHIGNNVMINGNVGIGTTNPGDFKLAVAGKIGAEEIEVKETIPDYVFEEDYELRSLEEVERFIAENKHLPDVPSAKEFENKPVPVGMMQEKHLQKIEELTLYLIEQNKELKNAYDKIEQLEERLVKLEGR